MRELFQGFQWLPASRNTPRPSTAEEKNGRSKKIGQTNQQMIHFVPNMYVSGKISALQTGTQTVMIFGTTKKSENYLNQRDFRIRGFLRVFCGVLPVLSPVV